MKSLLLVFAILNLVAAVTVVVLSSVTVGIHKAVVLSKYRELDLNGIIDKKALVQYDGGRFAGGDWGMVPHWLNEGEDGWVALAKVIAAFCAANGLVFGTFWIRTKGVAASPVTPVGEPSGA